MATPEFNAQFFSNQATIASFCGFSTSNLKPLNPFFDEECRLCGCEVGHLCTECLDEIDHEQCKRGNGHCVECYGDLLNNKKGA